MTRLAIYALGIMAAIVILTQVNSPTAVGIWTGVATGLLVPLIDVTLSNLKYLKLAIWSLRLANKRMRVSISYLYKIELDGKYLLVRGHRYPSQFQPVGGVYKFTDSARDKFSNWQVQTDDLIPIDTVSSDDLRVRVLGRNLIPFVRWFESHQNRETGPWREFCEELIQPGLLSFEDFWNIRAEFVRTHIHPVRFSPYADSYELLIADIYHIIPNEKQKSQLLEIAASDRDGAPRLFSYEQIRRRGAEPGIASSFTIPPTAEWTL